MTRILALALLAGGLSSCGGGEGSASCIQVLEIDGASYYVRDVDPGEIPTTGESSDAVIPGCNDAGQDEPDDPVRVDLVQGVPEATAVVFQDELYVRGGVQLPESAGDWYPSVSCREPDAFTLRGRLHGWSDPYLPTTTPVPEAPYEVHLTTRDDGRPYAGARLDVQVTAGTRSELTGADRDRTPLPATVTVRCDEGEFVATVLEIESR